MNRQTAVLWLSECANNVAGAGGKGAKLGQLIANIENLPGVGVPNGFVITVEACNRILSYNETLNRVNMQLQSSKTRTEVEQACTKLHDLIKTVQIPPEIRDHIYEKYLALSRKSESEQPFHVAVRSSAVVEDSHEHSMAGLFTSILHVASFDEMLTAIVECLASQYTERVVKYQLEHGLEPGGGFCSYCSDNDIFR
jgi:phosphoenolpyruvate synthase/pyruvate phosphate dikinase